VAAKTPLEHRPNTNQIQRRTKEANMKQMKQIRQIQQMKHAKTFAIVLAVLALVMAFSGCVDSDSGGNEAGSQDAAVSSSNYLDLVNVDALHYKATASSEEGSVFIFEEWRKRSGDVHLFKTIITDKDSSEPDIIILQNLDGMYMISEADGTAIRSGNCSDENIGFMNPFWAYGYYADEAAWDDSWIVDKDTKYLGRDAVKLDYSKFWAIYNAFSDEDIDPERADLIVDKETGFTLLLDWSFNHDGKTEFMRYEVTEFDVNGDIPESTFEIPSGVEIIDLGALGGAGAGAIPGAIPGAPGAPGGLDGIDGIDEPGGAGGDLMPPTPPLPE